MTRMIARPGRAPRLRAGENGQRARGDRTMEGVGATRSIEPAIRRAVALVTLLICSTAGVAGAQVSGRSVDEDLRLEWTAAEDRLEPPIASGYGCNQRSARYATS